MLSEIDNSFIRKAIALSQESIDLGCFPAGAIITRDGKQIGMGHSAATKDPTAHAEMTAIRNALSTHKTVWTGLVLYCSLEPCLMCLSATFRAQIGKVIFACRKEKVNPSYYEDFYENNLIQMTGRIEYMRAPQHESDALRIIDRREKQPK